MIPAFNEKGLLPAGIHRATWQEFEKRFGTTGHRRDLIAHLRLLMDHLREVGCTRIYIDGSFVTDKKVPNDYDACWDIDGVKIEELDPVLLKFDAAGKEEMQRKYKGDIRLAKCRPVEKDCTYLKFFQTDREGNPKGIVALDI